MLCCQVIGLVAADETETSLASRVRVKLLDWACSLFPQASPVGASVQ